ncbi:MAG: purine-binding chemotaxis protein CheW [Epulopiscium sp.]|nr:purine-binding chemotaxis protein CheW [Candidatus Epulonipiscium sp.]
MKHKEVYHKNKRGGDSVAVQQQVIFKLDQEEYGLDIMKVHGIEKHQPIVKVPNTPDYVEGIINLRGEVHPIYNLRKRFNLAPKAVDDSTKIIIVNSNEMMVGFMVDSVTEIVQIEEEQIDPPPKLITGIHSKYIGGVAKLQDRMVILLDIDLILSEEEQKGIQTVLQEKVTAESEDSAL